MYVGRVIWTDAVIPNSDFYERIAEAVLNQNNLRIFARIMPRELSGLLIATITDADLTGQRDLIYYFKKQFSGYPEQLQEQLYQAMTFKKTELELIACGDVL